MSGQYVNPFQLRNKDMVEEASICDIKLDRKYLLLHKQTQWPAEHP